MSSRNLLHEASCVTGVRTIRTSLFASDEENTDGLATRAGVFAGTGFTFRNNNCNCG